jgi:hypothetical protein
MRAFEPAREAIAQMQEVCAEARPGTFRLVARVEGTDLMEAPGG